MNTETREAIADYLVTTNERKLTMRPLNEIMEFDRVIEVLEDGTVADTTGVWAPEMWNDKLDSADWQLMYGYSGQWGYSGPTMHDSEYIGGGLERDILAEPGVYVALLSYDDCDECDDTDDCNCDLAHGWAVARLTDTAYGRYLAKKGN